MHTHNFHNYRRTRTTVSVRVGGRSNTSLRSGGQRVLGWCTFTPSLGFALLGSHQCCFEQIARCDGVAFGLAFWESVGFFVRSGRGNTQWGTIATVVSFCLEGSRFKRTIPSISSLSPRLTLSPNHITRFNGSHR